MMTTVRCEGLLSELSAALDLALKKGAEDPEVHRHVARFYGALREALAEQEGEAVSLKMRESLFVHRGVPLAEVSIRGRSTIAFLRFAGAGGMEFSPATTQDDVVRLVRLARGVCEGEDWAYGEGQREVLESLRGARLLAPSDSVTWDWIDDGPAGDAYTRAGLELESAGPVRREIAESVDRAMDIARAGGSVQMDEARGLSEQVLHATEAGFDNIMQLAERPEFDVFTVQHSLRVSLLATYVAGQMGAHRDVLIELGAAAMLHDIGKGRIPHEVLYKPARLDEDERRVMVTHPQLGAEILLESPGTSACALGAAWGHHLRHDGRGYPDRRPWFRTSSATSLIQVCDVYEALTARRPYKAPYSPARAYQILYSDQGAFDPAALSAFTRAMGLYPPGRFVQLSDGRFGRVARAGRALDRPTVRTVPDGEMVPLDAPENAHLCVRRLLDEPEFVEQMIQGSDPASVDEPSERDRTEEHEARKEELEFLSGDSEASDDCDHGDDCRLC